MPRPPRDADALLVCADVLGTFGVTTADINRSRDAPSDEPLEAALADILSDGRNRTAVLRQTIARSDRGLNCAARYARESLEREITAVFEAIDWSFALSPVGRGSGASQRLHLEATDHGGRRRETAFDYPDTPLGTDNLPAVLHAINEGLLTGTDARFVLLSSGVDRWRAALVDERELERLQDRYGPRITAVERSLLPEHDLEAYVPDDSEPSAADADDPWPAWAHDRERDSGYDAGDEPTPLEDGDDGIGSLIEEAEGETESASEQSGATEPAPSAAPAPETQQREPDTVNRTTSSPSREANGFELRGSPTVSRVSGGEDSSRTTAETTERGSDDARADAADGESEPASTSVSSAKSGSESESNSDDDDGFGTLSGTTTTTRVSNDSFGSDVEWETEDERYQALGAALGAGGNVSVEGLLEDDDFLPELPAVEPEEQRIEFDDPFDPGAVREAKAAAEQSGFVWVDSGTLETTRLSNG